VYPHSVVVSIRPALLGDDMMSSDKLKELKVQLDLVIRMVEERKREKYDEYWDEVIKQYRKIRGLLDQDSQDISEISKYSSIAFGVYRNAFDSFLFKDYFDPLANEMGKVIDLLKALNKE
jgi:hypothetical protein